jgi:uncharacterized protein (UPF0276 family)
MHKNRSRIINCEKAGIGLRSEHHEEVLKTRPNVNWWEIHTENFFADGGPQLLFLENIRSHYPLSFHGVGLSLGSHDRPNINHLSKIKSLVTRFQPFLISEHLSWSSVNKIFANDLLPLPYNEESLKIFCRNIEITQEFLQSEILIENPSSYLTYKSSTITEEEFINQTAYNTGCKLLLDINNIYVSSFNNNFDPYKYIDNISPQYVKEIHLAGHSILKTPNSIKLLDTHDDFVIEEVWKLYNFAVKKFGKTQTLLEWDQDLPSLDTLIIESSKAQKILDSLYETEKVTV